MSEDNVRKSAHTIRWKDYLYLYSLYFKRGMRMNVFYVIMLFLCLTIPSFLIESNAKIKQLLVAINDKLPPNRVKLIIPSNERQAPQKGLLSSLFHVKAKPTTGTIARYKDFITPEMLHQVRDVKGVGNIVPIYSIDFPMGIVFAIPGSNTPIQTQMIGSGLSAKDAQSFINPGSSIQNFVYHPGKKVPILLSRFILPVVNTVAQNNGVRNFQLTEKDLVGFTIKVFVGKSKLSDQFDALGNGDEKDEAHWGSVNFSDVVECTVAGFVDMDYSIGLAFPQSFLDVYKKKYWANFQPNFYDSLVVDVPFARNVELQEQFKSMGYQIGEDTGILNKISIILQQQQKWIGIFLQLISMIIFGFGVIILFFSILWILQGKTLEFSIYQFFGASARRVVFLYTCFLCTLNLIGFVLSWIALSVGFTIIGDVVSSFKDRVSKELESLFDLSLWHHFLVIRSLFLIGFFFLALMSFTFVYRYIKRLNDNM